MFDLRLCQTYLIHCYPAKTDQYDSTYLNILYFMRCRLSMTLSKLQIHIWVCYKIWTRQTRKLEYEQTFWFVLTLEKNSHPFLQREDLMLDEMRGSDSGVFLFSWVFGKCHFRGTSMISEKRRQRKEENLCFFLLTESPT